MRVFQSLPAVVDQPFFVGCFALGTTSEVRISKEGTSNWIAEHFCDEKTGFGSQAAAIHCSRLKKAATGSYVCQMVDKTVPISALQRFTVNTISALAANISFISMAYAMPAH